MAFRRNERGLVIMIRVVARVRRVELVKQCVIGPKERSIAHLSRDMLRSVMEKKREAVTLLPENISVKNSVLA